jgi:hypothetical protein
MEIGYGMVENGFQPPPKSSTEMIRRASEDISQVSTKNRLDHEQLSQVASHFDLNQDGVLSSDEIQNAADSILNPPCKE